MRISETDIKSIRENFSNLKSKDDLLDLLNKAAGIVYGRNTEPIWLKTLSYYANPKIAKNRYYQFQINKKSGKKRDICSPTGSLKYIQNSINIILQCLYEPHPAAKGFVNKKSIVDNAKVHTNMNYVFNIDLLDFFPSIDLRRVQKVLTLPPFNLIDTKTTPLAFLIAKLCCAEMQVERKDDNGNIAKTIKEVLPQGAPTSPILSNIIANRLDRKLTGLAKRFGLNYTRYADDITFSSFHNVYKKDSKFIKELHRIIKSQNFQINEKKTRLQKRGYRQEVTGLVVNEKVNTVKRYTKQLRMWLYYWENYGYQKASEIFLRDYLSDKGYIKKRIPNFNNVLEGKLLFLRMVKGAEDSVYKKLENRLLKLNEAYTEEKVRIAELEKVIDIWQKKGMDEAIKLYNKISQPNG